MKLNKKIVNQLQKILKTRKFKYVNIYQFENKIVFGFNATDLLETDTYVEFLTDIETNNKQEIKITIDANSFKNIITVMGQCEMEITDSKIIFKDENITQSLETLSFTAPNINDVELIQTSFILNSDEFKNALKKVKYAIGEEVALKAIYNIHGEIANKNTYRIVASDGYRLVFVDFPVNYRTHNSDLALRLNEKQVNTLIKLLPKNKNVEVNISKDYVNINVENLAFTFRRETEQFPDYKRVIPSTESIKTKIIFEKNKILNMLKQFGKGTKTILEIVGNQMTISLVDDKNNKELVNMTLNVNKDGEDMKIGFDSMYLLDLLKNVDDDIITLQIIDSLAPAIVAKQNELHLLLPIRL